MSDDGVDNGGREEEEEEEEEEEFEELFEEIPSNLLDIVKTLENDFFVGVMSKYVFKRHENCEQRRFPLEEELAFYTIHHLRPTLKDILTTGNGNHRFYLWLAMEIAFQKMVEEELETGESVRYLTRWSSMRNRSMFSPMIHTVQERDNFVDEFTTRFSLEVTVDTTEMEELFSSGWVFTHIVQAHIRFCRGTPANILRFSGRAKRANTFNQETAKIFGRRVVDPSVCFTDDQQSNPTCLPQSIALSLLTSLNGQSPSDLTKTELKRAMEGLTFQTLLKTDGIPITDIPTIETLNKQPFSRETLDIFPQLSSYQGLAINLFTGRMVHTNNGPPHFCISPMLLSRFHSDYKYRNVDLLIDHASFHKCGNSVSSYQKHILCITNLSKLCAARSKLYKTNVSRYEHICRKCLKLFQSLESCIRHMSQCNFFVVGRPFQPRRTRNSKYYQPFRYNKYSKKMEQNYVRFKTGDLYKTLKPLTSTFIGQSFPLETRPYTRQHQSRTSGRSVDGSWIVFLS